MSEKNVKLKLMVLSRLIGAMDEKLAKGTIAQGEDKGVQAP